MAQPAQTPGDCFNAAWVKIRPGFWAVVLLSAVINVLMFAGPLYMLQVYDRVLASRSLETLAVLSFALFATYAIQAWFDGQRARIVTRLGRIFDSELKAPVTTLLVRLSVAGVAPVAAMRPVKDLEQIRHFTAGQGPGVLADLPFMPLFVLASFVLHFWIGVLVVAGIAVLFAIGLWADRAARAAELAFSDETAARASWVEALRHNAGAVAAMGMERSLLNRMLNGASGGPNNGEAAIGRAADAHAGVAAWSRAMRLGLQSAVLGLGAFLVIQNEMMVGAMIAASILAGRALQPAEQAIAQWSGFVAARAALARLQAAVALLPAPRERLALHAPSKSLEVEAAAVMAPSGRLVMAGAAFRLEAGDILGVIGPSGSGKTSLIKALSGIWPLARGAVRMDGTDLRHWQPEELARHIGYLPQEASLFDASIGENIARMQAGTDAGAVRAAAESAGAHALIQGLPEGYGTRCGEGGTALSSGQRQRIGLARALYGDPFLIVLDEPNANLDSAGEAALARSLKALSARGAITIVVAHRTQILHLCTKLLLLEGGTQKLFGPCAQVLAHIRGAKERGNIVPMPRANAAANQGSPT